MSEAPQETEARRDGAPRPAGAPRRTARIRAWLCAYAALVLLAGPVFAQSLHVGVGGGSQYRLIANAWLRLEGYRPPGASPTTVSFEVRAPAPMVGLGLSTNQSFGPLGNVVFEGWGALAGHPTGGAAAEGSLGARGVLGPVAVRLNLLGFGSVPGTFRPSALASDERPHLGTPAFGVQTAVTWRVGRDLILEAQPEVYLTGAGTALRLDAALRMLRTLGAHELALVLHGYGSPGLSDGAAAAGVAVTFNRGRDPAITVGATVGYSAAGVWPGLSLALGQRVGVVRLDLSAALEPYRADVPALRVTASVRTPLEGLGPQGTELRIEGALTSTLGLATPVAPGTAAWLGLAVVLPVMR